MACTNYYVHTALREDLNEGWIWIRNFELREKLQAFRQIVRIKTSHRKGSICCEALYAEKSYLKHFNNMLEEDQPETIDSKTADCLVFMSQWYRHRLGITPGPGVAMEIDFPTNRLQTALWQFCACLQHPQVVVLLATTLGIIGVGLGILGLGLGLIGIQHWGPSAENVGIALMVIGAVVVALGIPPLFTRRRGAPA